MKRKIICIALTLTIFFAAMAPAYAALFYNEGTPVPYQLDAVEDLMVELKTYYKDDISYDQMIQGIYKGLFESLGDQWSEYYVPGTSSGLEVLTQSEETFTGVGVQITMQGDRVYVSAAIVNSPAYEAGIKTGDYLIRINGIDVKGKTLEEVSQELRGKEGTSVMLTIDRGGTEMYFSIVRRSISGTSVGSSMLEGSTIGYIDINEFNSSTSFDFLKARERLLADGATSLILDLRDNRGGIMSEAISVADQMIPTQGRVITKYIRQGKVTDTFYSTGGFSGLKKLPCIVLTNSMTASASEMLVAALKDNGVAKVYGSTTYGKGVAQSVGDAKDGASFKFSTCYFIRPNGEDINEKGIEPDVRFAEYDGIAAAIIGSGYALAPMNETARYYPGEMGLNVYAAQQRLILLGYDVDLTGINDKKTTAAIMEIQKTIGISYGRLDYHTMEEIERLYQQIINPASSNASFEAAVKELSK